MLHAQLRGNNQGVVKLIGDGMPKGNPGLIKRVKESKVSCLVDGAKNHGMIVLEEACDIAIGKAKDIGVGIVGTFNTRTSTGCLGYYCENITKKGLVSIILAGSPLFCCSIQFHPEALWYKPHSLWHPLSRWCTHNL